MTDGVSNPHSIYQLNASAPDISCPSSNFLYLIVSLHKWPLFISIPVFRPLPVADPLLISTIITHPPLTATELWGSVGIALTPSEYQIWTAVSFVRGVRPCFSLIITHIEVTIIYIHRLWNMFHYLLQTNITCSSQSKWWKNYNWRTIFNLWIPTTNRCTRSW